ncbi:UDP-2,3-diacylglucosamine diphosphatase LpxI [Alsobacter sp. SYSU M60028]|uniref:UDP-2,3-diacylglucosamine diphosphatase LpxI n=1 Tax=Alsobacter ponti TaxID=2962936 RepID=A0ABT1L9N3_9HYPH|nr:UDP-2,3-diacylglucosamine diphosphatase LpxI [Alsobacter ponti]MCP8938207.1 UDP-2,3-diacylglucosamine diphosphatase LpxI [Alsobacter ponti]
MLAADLPRRIAIIAGGGAFPLAVANAAAAQGCEVRVIGLRGFAERALRRFPTVWADMLDPGRVLAELRAIAPDAVVLAGNVTRPGPLAIRSVFSAFRNRDELGRILSAGDDRLLRGVVSLIEDAGFRVVGAQAVAPELLAPAGVLTRSAPDAAAEADIAKAVELLRSLGPFDVGQGAVLSGGRVLAVEGPEGTDAMLARVRQLQRRRRLRLDGSGGVLVKLPKPGQETRIDLPAVGPRTVDRARAAGLSGIAVAAGGVLLLDRPVLVRAADAAGLFLVGIPA